MVNVHKPLLVGILLWEFASGCSSKESLLDGAGNGGSKAGASAAAAGTGARGGSAGASGGASGAGAVMSNGGTTPGAGRSAGGASTAGTAQVAGNGGTANGGDGPTGGVRSTGGTGMGGAGAGESSGGAGSGAGGAAGAGGCPSGQMWCGGCTVGSGVCALACPTHVCPSCADATTLDACQARTDCHAVFQDPGTCGCGSVGCCAKFQRCADGAKANCQAAPGLACGAMTPYCESPAYVVSYTATCFEGCVTPEECAPK